MLGGHLGAASLVPPRASSRPPRTDLLIMIGFVDVGFSEGARSLVPPQASSRSPRTNLRILIDFVVVGYFSRCCVVGIAPGVLSVSPVGSSVPDRFCRC